MSVGGCDAGSATGKAIVTKDSTIASYTIIPSTTRPQATASIATTDEVIEKLTCKMIAAMWFKASQFS